MMLVTAIDCFCTLVLVDSHLDCKPVRVPSYSRSASVVSTSKPLWTTRGAVCNIGLISNVGMESTNRDVYTDHSSAKGN